MPTENQNRTIDELTSHDDLLAAFKTLYNVSEEDQSNRFKQVRRNWMFYFGNQYLADDLAPDDRVPLWRKDLRITRNICFQAIETIRPILRRGYPKLFVHADFPESVNQGSSEKDGDLAMRMQEIFEAEHERRGEGIEVAKLIADARIQGVAYRKVLYNEARNRVEQPILPYDSVLTDPFGTQANFEDHKYVIHRTMMDVGDIERLYGVKEKDFGGEVGDDPDGSSGDKFGLVRRIKRMLADDTRDVKWQRKRYEVAEMYYNEASNAAMGFNERPKSLKFPKGRMVVMINKKLIPSQFQKMQIPYSHGEFPIVSYHAYPLSQQFHSHGDIDQLTSIQMAINVLYSQVIINAIQMSNAQWIVEDGAIPHRWLTNQPGLIIRTKPGKFGLVEKLDPSQIPTGVFGLVQELEQFADRQTGSQDVVRGESPGSSASGVLANSLQAAAMTRHTFSMQVLDESYRRASKLEVSTFQDWVDFSDPRFNGKRDMGEWLRWDEDMRNLLFDVVVESRANFPQNVLARINHAQNMLALGVFDLEEFMDFSGIEVREDLRTKIRQLSDSFIPGVAHNEQVALQIQSGGGVAGPGQQSLGQAAGVPGLGQGVNQAAAPVV